jgi:deazaflavin-dependent oxidoreductase (nitroreductase family)
MPLEGEYEPSPSGWVRDQVELYERTGGREGNVQRPTGLPVVILTVRGRKSGKLRKMPLMRVERDGKYAIVASKGGAPDNPKWYKNVKANPDVMLQDGPEPFDARARELHGEERELWWRRAVEAFPPYADYEKRTKRLIPVFLIEGKDDAEPKDEAGGED